MLGNIVPHYENDHTNCGSQSRCRSDSNYKQSRELLTQDISKDLLQQGINKLQFIRILYIFVMQKTHFM